MTKFTEDKILLEVDKSFQKLLDVNNSEQEEATSKQIPKHNNLLEINKSLWIIIFSKYTNHSM